MRHLGNLPDEKQALAFGDHLVASGIHNLVEPDPDGSWMVWVKDEDQQTEAQTALQKFRQNPDAPEFSKAAAAAAKVREAEARDLKAYNKRVRVGRQVFPKFGGSYGVGPVTYALIFGCCMMAFFSDLGKNVEFLRGWLISDLLAFQPGFLPEVFSGQVWRVFTPIFIHFGIFHLVFNMMWLFQLGCMIEGLQGTWRFAALVAGIALVSNVAQYYFNHPFFGGMSGVVYGLAGYIWIRGKYDSTSGLFLDQMSFIILTIGLIGAYAGLMGRVANTAHLVGLLTGMAWGGISAFWARRKSR